MSLQELLKLDDKTILSKYAGLMLKHYIAYFGNTCTSCPSKYFNYLQKLRAMKNKKQNEEAKTSKAEFRLKKGVLIPNPATGEGYTEHNITDAMAKKLLKENENRIVLFAEYPEDWKKQL